MGERGSALILVLFSLGVLSMLSLSLAYRSGLASRSAREDAIMAKLRGQAQSAVVIAMARLRENQNAFDDRREPWHRGNLEEDGWSAEWESGWGREQAEFRASYEVVDEESKLNVHFASSEALEKLGMRRDQIASLLDWIDEDDSPRAEGAESDYYLEGASSHRAKNGKLEVLEELLLIRGFTREDYWGEDRNHNSELDPSEDDGALSPPADNADGRLQLGWVDLLTCVGDGRVNLNTAPRTVLEALPLSDGAADQIAAFRSFDEGSLGRLEDHVFRSEKDIEALQGLSARDKELLKQLSVFKSSHFRVFAEAYHPASGLRFGIEALVKTGEEGERVLEWKTER